MWLFFGTPCISRKTPYHYFSCLAFILVYRSDDLLYPLPPLTVEDQNKNRFPVITPGIRPSWDLSYKLFTTFHFFCTQQIIGFSKLAQHYCLRLFYCYCCICCCYFLHLLLFIVEVVFLLLFLYLLLLYLLLFCYCCCVRCCYYCRFMSKLPRARGGW